MNRILYWPYYACFAGCLILFVVALHFWGAVDIRADGGIVSLLTVIGMFWLMFATRLFSWLGLSLVDDVVGQRNVAALIALCGAILAVGLIYAGGNIGEGPSYWNNVFSVAVGTFGMVALWILLEVGSNISLSITEDRDVASGIRMCGFLVAIGLLFGRAVAGDWHSEEATIRDFIHDGWPANVIWAAALGIERYARPNPRCPARPWGSYGLFPAMIYLVLAGVWLCHIGAWEGMS